MKNHQATFRRAVTLTELLVVLAIISLLATLAVPVFVQKTEQARRATARFEVREIANAEEIVAITHGFYVPIHILDNQPNLSSGASSDPRDDFDNYGTAIGLGSVNLINPNTNVTDQQGNQEDLGSSNIRVQNLITYWNGPFLNPVRVYKGTDPDNNPGTMTDDEVALDFVLDPWGAPYRFYSPLGLLSTQDDSQVINSNNNTIDDGLITTADDHFERYAIVSYGSNAVSDEGGTATVDDDIYYEFGFEGNESAFNIF